MPALLLPVYPQRDGSSLAPCVAVVPLDPFLHERYLEHRRRLEAWRDDSPDLRRVVVEAKATVLRPPPPATPDERTDYHYLYAAAMSEEEDGVLIDYPGVSLDARTRVTESCLLSLSPDDLQMEFVYPLPGQIKIKAITPAVSWAPVFNARLMTCPEEERSDVFHEFARVDPQGALRTLKVGLVCTLGPTSSISETLEPFSLTPLLESSDPGIREEAVQHLSDLRRPTLPPRGRSRR